MNADVVVYSYGDATYTRHTNTISFIYRWIEFLLRARIHASLHASIANDKFRF